MQDFIRDKKCAPNLPFFLEYVNGPDGCTALLRAVKKGDMITVKLVNVCKSQRLVTGVALTAVVLPAAGRSRS